MGTHLALVDPDINSFVNDQRTQIGEARALARTLETLAERAERAADTARSSGLSDAYREELRAEAETLLGMVRTLVASAHRRNLKRSTKK